MFKKQWLALAVLVVATLSLTMYGCGGDDPVSPGNGGGDTGTKIAAGIYETTLSLWTCGMTDTMSITEQEVMCTDFSFDELFELGCPVTIANNSFNVDCTTTEGDEFCSYTERVQVTGIKVGNTWTVTGTITISNQNPENCSGEPACINAMVVLDMISGPPSACTYAGTNSIEATIVGGPLAGNTDFETSGFGFGVEGIFTWNFFGDAGSGSFPVQQKGTSSFNLANIGVDLADIDVSSLPVTFSVFVGIGDPETISALPTGSVTYFDLTTDGVSFFGTQGSGSITVNEVSDTHIAGTINSLSIEGQEIPSEGGTPTAAMRSLSGGFHVREDSESPTTGLLSRKGWVGRMLSKR